MDFQIEVSADKQVSLCFNKRRFDNITRVDLLTHNILSPALCFTLGQAEKQYFSEGDVEGVFRELSKAFKAYRIPVVKSSSVEMLPPAM